MFLDHRRGWEIPAHLRADSVVMRGRTLCGIVLALGDRPVERPRPFQNGNLHAHCEHEQREPQRSALPSQTNRSLHQPTLSA